MPVVNPGSKVLVTGVNGYIAFWLAKKLLEQGYSVRGTVRSIQRSGNYINNYFKPYGDRFELVEIPDLTKEGAFDEAIKGIEAVEHAATPVDFTVEDPRAYIDPAVDGVLSILRSALKYGSNLRRFIYVSSVAAIADSTPPAHPVTYSEKDWNDGSIKAVETLGEAATPVVKYSASKTLAERAAWDFVAEHKDQITWDLTAIHPPYVFGPIVHEVSSVDTLNASSKIWYNGVLDPGPKSKEEAGFNSPWVDVRDLCDTLIWSIEKDAAGGERFLVAAGTFTWQDWIDAAASLNPYPNPSRKPPVGYPDVERVYTFNLDTSNAARIFGIKYRTLKETAKDILADFEARGL